MKWVEAWIATKEEAAERFTICKKCDRMSNIKTCDICGCFMPVKTKIRPMECPAGKWGKIKYVSDAIWKSDDPTWDEDVRD